MLKTGLLPVFWPLNHYGAILSTLCDWIHAFSCSNIDAEGNLPYNELSHWIHLCMSTLLLIEKTSTSYYPDFDFPFLLQKSYSTVSSWTR